MKTEILDGNGAAAVATKLARVKSVPCFPITPQTEIIETLARWKANKEVDLEFTQLEGEHSALSAALGSEMTGARTFTATSSQGLLYMHEILPIVSGTRMPMVMVNVSRGLSAPITLWPDHNDFLSMRDSGWIMFSCETNQEVLDSVIMSYKIAENERVLLPVLVNMDGFIHSYTRTEVDVPSQSLVDRFLPKLKLKIKLDVNNPKTLGTPAMEEHMFFRSQVHKAQLDSKKIIKKVQKEWSILTGRKYDVIEKYKLNGAKAAVVMMGANTTIAKSVIDKLRKKGKKIGLLRIRLLRPFPEKEVKNALSEIKRIAFLDQNISPGQAGILFTETRGIFDKKVISNYIISLGGKPISEKEFIKVFNEVLKSNKGQRKWLL